MVGMMRKMGKAWVGGMALILFAALVVAAVPFSDSTDFFIDTFSALFEPNYAESPDFGVATTLPMTEPGFDESNTFALDTNLSFSLPGFAAAAPMAMDTRRINRAWGDSEAFLLDRLSGCDNVIAHFRFDGNTADSSGNRLNAALNCVGALYVPGIQGQALQFSGELSCFAEVAPNSLIAPRDGITVAAWIRPEAFLAPYACVLYKAGLEPTATGFRDRSYTLWLTSNGGVHWTSTPEGSPSQVICQSPPNQFALDEWVHVAGVVDAIHGVMSIYVNGQNSVTCAYPVGAILAGNYPLRIGAPFATLDDQAGLLGPIDEVRLYDRALSSDEVALLPASSGPCVNPALTVVPTQIALGVNGGIGVMAVLNRGGGIMPWTASVLPDAPWLALPIGDSGINAGLVFASAFANPNEGPRTGTIRISAPGAAPPFVDVTVTQSGTAPPPQVTHFEFDPIEGPYMVNEDIPVTIRAIDASNPGRTRVQTAFNGCAALSTNSSAFVWPNTLCFQNGQAIGNLSLDLPFIDTIVSANASGLSGESNPFNVQSATGETGCIAGAVIRFIGTSFGDGPAEVQLYSLDGALLATQTTSDRTCSGRQVPMLPLQIGLYCFCDLAPGDYQLAAVQGVGLSLRSTVPVSAGRTSPHIITLGDSSKPPVLLVPGILGSREKWGLYPVITGMPGHIERDQLKVIDFRPERKYVWRQLRLALTPHFRIVETPWDWRATINDQVVDKYLIDAIEKAKERPDGTEWPKVHVAAHSAGGLLVRHYIQSSAYQNDIDSFAMVGTPNQGAAIIYFLWEGANAARADEIAEGSLYETTIEKIYDGTRDDDFPGEYVDAKAIIRSQFMRRYIPGLGDLMMTTPFLLRDCQALPGFLSFCQEDSAWDVPSPRLLVDLRTSDGRMRMSDEHNTDPDRVRTKLFLSRTGSAQLSVPCTNKLKAVARVLVGPRNLRTGLYEDGDPTDHVCGPGDGTVLFYDKSSVGLDHISQVLPCDEEAFQEAEHVLLMRAYAPEICTFLNNNVPCDSTVPRTEEAEGEPIAWLSVSIDGRVQPFLTSPDGTSAGIDPYTGDVDSTVIDAELEIGPRSAGIFIPDPQSGVYELQLTAVPGDVFTVEVSYADADGIVETFARGIYHDGIMSLMVDLDTTTGPALAISVPLSAPANVRSEPVDGLARIVWDAPDDPLVTGYNLYARAHEMPKFTLLGTTTATTFDTGHPWNVAGSAPTWHYFVVSVADDGTESFFTEMVENRHRLVARFSVTPLNPPLPRGEDGALGDGTLRDDTVGDAPVTVAFTDESAGEAFAWAWDFDGDGAIDSTEQDPTWTYEEPGHYTVTLTVGGPEGTDTTVRPGAVVVGPLPELNRPGDFNGDGVVDLLDYAAFSERMSGPFVGPTLAGWHIFDLDYDYDVDLDDLHLWVQLLVGSSPADPG